MDNRQIGDLLDGVTTAHLADACLAQNVQLRVAPPQIRPLITPVRVAGRALPVVHHGSVDVFFDAMTRADDGDILVIDNGDRRDEACIGDLTVAEAVAFGIGAFVLWGMHRDTAELIEIGLPIFSSGFHPVGPRGVRAATQTACKIGDFEVTRDDVVIADADGILFVPLANIKAVAEAARNIANTERLQRARLAEGITLHQQFEWETYAAARAKNPKYTLREHLRSLNRAIEV